MPAAAAAGQGRSRGRRPRPGPRGFTIEGQLLGGEAGRRLAQEQTEAIAALLVWLAAHLPTPAAVGSAASAGARRAERGGANQDAAGPAEPSRVDQHE
jgi:hypothetical protein